MPAKYFTLEQLRDGKWELIWTANSLDDAISMFRGKLLGSDTAIIRLTSPTDTSIYR